MMKKRGDLKEIISDQPAAKKPNQLMNMMKKATGLVKDFTFQMAAYPLNELIYLMK